jgi:hypothetical protein
MWISVSIDQLRLVKIPDPTLASPQTVKPEDFPLHLWDFDGDRWTTGREEGM